MSEGHSNPIESLNSIKLQQEDKSQEEQERSENNLSKKRVHRKQQISNFIMKTYKILEDRKNCHIVEWTDGGSCFIVKNKDLFQNQILPKYFKHKKFSSFVRQLNMYDFHKIRKQKEIPIFKHKFFKMGCFELLHKIKRKSGEEPKEDDPSRMLISLGDLSMKEQMPIKSALSIRSKGVQSFSEDIEDLMRQNNELRSNINEINRQIGHLELNKSKKQEKLLKLFSAAIYFDLNQPLDSIEENASLRQLQHHFSSEQDPLSFQEYARKLNCIYQDIFSIIGQ